MKRWVSGLMPVAGEARFDPREDDPRVQLVDGPTVARGKAPPDPDKVQCQAEGDDAKKQPSGCGARCGNHRWSVKAPRQAGKIVENPVDQRQPRREVVRSNRERPTGGAVRSGVC